MVVRIAGERMYLWDTADACALDQAPLAAPGQPNIEKDETVDDCQLPAVEQREETSRRVHHEIGNGHVAREDKDDGAGEQGHRPSRG